MHVGELLVQSFEVVDHAGLADSQGGILAARLDDQRIAQARLRRQRLAVTDHGEGRRGEAFGQEQFLGAHFVLGQAEAEGPGTGNRGAGEFEEGRGVHFLVAVPPDPFAQVDDQFRCGGAQRFQECCRVGAERNGHRPMAEGSEGLGHCRRCLGSILFGNPVNRLPPLRGGSGEVVADCDDHCPAPAVKPSRRLAVSTTARISSS